MASAVPPGAAQPFVAGRRPARPYLMPRGR
jgi:hypothetical protein